MLFPFLTTMKKIKIKSSRKELIQKIREFEYYSFVLFQALLEMAKEEFPEDNPDRELLARNKADRFIEKVKNELKVKNDTKEEMSNKQ